MPSSAKASGVKPTRQPAELSDADIAAVHSWIIHEDAHIIAFNKPSGLSSQGGRVQAHTLDDLLWAFARSNGKRPELVHRLDRDTSGVILAAKTKPAAGYLGKAMQMRRFQKTYQALISTAPEPKSGRITAALRREEIGRESYMRVVEFDAPNAVGAVSAYRTLSANEDGALVELSPETGRMHQLRVHMAHLGRPLVGDVRYGGALTFAGRGASRLMLHAAKLAFPHPETNERVVLEAPLPDDFETLKQAAGL